MISPNTSTKTIIIGDHGVGKTTFVKRLRTGEFERNHVSTLGVEVHPVEYSNKTFMMWDCGSGKYAGTGPDYHYQNASYAIIVFDITRLDTARSISSNIREVRRICGNIPIAVHMNKIDARRGGGSLLIKLKELLSKHKNVKCFGISSASCYNLYDSLNWFASL